MPLSNKMRIISGSGSGFDVSYRTNPEATCPCGHVPQAHNSEGSPGICSLCGCNCREKMAHMNSQEDGVMEHNVRTYK